MGVVKMRMTPFIIDDLIRPIMLEIKATAKAVGVELPDNIVDLQIRLDPIHEDFLPSMGQDAQKVYCSYRVVRGDVLVNARVQGNYLELEPIVGEPLREAERLGVPTPTLKTIYGLLKGLQAKTKEAKGDWTPQFEDGNPYR